MPRSEKQKMIAGEQYLSDDPELVAERAHCQTVLREFNSLPERELKLTELGSLFGATGDETVIEAPFLCDYGYNIEIGRNSFWNYGGIALDVSPIVIGSEVWIATGVQIVTAEHPMDPVARRAGGELSRPITIGDGVWIGAGAIVLPGVTIGENAVIGAGSIVNRDIPAGMLAVGNPCRVVRAVTDGD